MLQTQITRPVNTAEERLAGCDIAQKFGMDVTTEHMDGPQLLAGGADLMIPAKPSRARQQSYRQTGPDQISECWGY